MYPHWKPLQPLCSWSGYGPGDEASSWELVSLDDAELKTPWKKSTHWTVRSAVQVLIKKPVGVSIVGKCEIWYHEKQMMILGTSAERFLQRRTSKTRISRTIQVQIVTEFQQGFKETSLRFRHLKLCSPSQQSTFSFITSFNEQVCLSQAWLTGNSRARYFLPLNVLLPAVTFATRKCLLIISLAKPK